MSEGVWIAGPLSVEAVFAELSWLPFDNVLFYFSFCFRHFALFLQHFFPPPS